MNKVTLQRNLIQWFKACQRPLPWRKNYGPYEVWISEIMLQQTQMDTAVPYFDRWMKSFPTLRALADASLDQVLKHWEGLGYYSRARNLHHSAQIIQKNFQGQFPSAIEDIRSLKGIGPYTAGAIASIAFNQEEAIVDGNILRVLSRVYRITDNIDIPKNRQRFWALEKSLIPKGQARLFNQALMELGALICSPTTPKCADCPLQKNCLAYSHQDVERFPIRSPRKKTVKVFSASILLQQKDQFLIFKRPTGEIMGGLWEFPEWKLKSLNTPNAEKAKSELEAITPMEFSQPIGQLEWIQTLKRSYTHHLETMFVFQAKSQKVKNLPSTRKHWQKRWADRRELKQFAFSSAHARIAKWIQNDHARQAE